MEKVTRYVSEFLMIILVGQSEYLPKGILFLKVMELEKDRAIVLLIKLLYSMLMKMMF